MADEPVKLINNPRKKVRWYVLSANYKKEIAVRDELVSLGYPAYVPMCYDLRRKGGHRERVLRPAIHELVFVRASIDQLLAFKHSSRNNPYIFFRSTRQDHHWTPIAVSDADMENFMRLTAMTEVGLTYFKPEELRLGKGQRVKIMDGLFKDIVGTIRKLPHKRGDYLVVEIPGVTTVAARIKPDFVQPVDREVARSTDVPGDVRRLTDMACRLLYDLPATTATELQRSVLIGEMQTVRASLVGCKTFMPGDKVAYALAQFLAAAALHEEPPADQVEVLRTVTPRLRSVSLLRLRASLYLAAWLHDDDAARYVKETMASWTPVNSTEAQKELMAERKKVMGYRTQ